MPKAASAAERAAEKWSSTTKEAGRSSEEFSRRVRRTIADLEFERQQLARNATERARFATLRRAGVAEASAEGQAILASVRALEAQRAALGHVAIGTRAAGAAAASMTTVFRSMLATIGPVVLVFAAIQKVMNAFDVASNLGEAAEQIGVTTRNLQALQFAATQSNVKVEQLDTGLSKFSQKMGEAAEGSKEMIDALNLLGVKNLDAAGKLRPTEDLLVDVAKAITSIDDPARRSAAAVDFFGKAGTRMLPMLAEIATGMDNVAQKADNAGAIIDDKTSATLDRLGDAMARLSQIITANLAVGLARLVSLVEGVTIGMLRLADVVGAGLSTAFESFVKFSEQLSVEGARGVAMFVEAFVSMPEMLGQMFTNAWEVARIATNKGINAITKLVSDNLPSWLGGGFGGTNLNETPGGGVGPVGAGLGDRMTAAGNKAAAEMQARIEAARQAHFSRSITPSRATSTMGDVARTGTIGAGTSAVKGAGKEAEDAEKKYAKLITTLDLAVSAQDNMTAAAMRGEQAYEGMKIHLEAQQKSLEIYGRVLDDTDPKLKAIEDRLLKIAQGKAAESFAKATKELEQQNVILEKQIELMNQAPQIQAQEIALIKAKQEAEKAGIAVTVDMVEQRRKAIEQNETLKNQQEELKRAQDLWTAPLKSALQSIQQTGADAFEQLFETGKFSFESLSQVFTKTLRRMAAEFLALATIRPVMSVILNAISPSMAQQMGVGSSSLPGGGGGLLGGLFGGGGGGISSWLGSTISGNLPSGQFGPPAPGQSFSSGFLGDITWGQGLGALAGAGMGAYNLINSKSTGQTIGGIASLVGAGVSLIPGVGQIAGPIIGLLGGLLPGLFGEEEKVPPRPPLQYGGGTISAGSFRYSGDSLNGSGTLQSAAKDVGTSVLGLFKRAGLIAVEGQMIGGSLASGVNNIWNAGNRSYDKQNYTQTGLQLPGGGFEQLTYNDTGRDLASAQDYLTTQIFKANLFRGGVTGASQNLLNAVGQANPQSLEELSTIVDEIKAFDDAVKGLGKTMTAVEQAVTSIEDQFAQLYDTADKYGLDTGAIDIEKNRQLFKVAADFADDIYNQTVALKDPTTAALQAIEKERKAVIENNTYIVEHVNSSMNQIVQIEELYALKRQKVTEESENARLAAAKQTSAALIDNVTASVSRVQDLIRQLSPGGSLANVDPATQLAGLRASAAASYAQAISDPANFALIQRAVEDAQAFAETSLRFNAGNAVYERDRQTILSQQQALQQATIGGGIAQAADPELKDLFRRLLQVTEGRIGSERDADMNKLINLLLRFFADEAA